VVRIFAEEYELLDPRLHRSDVLCLPAFRPFRHVKLYSLAFLQAPEATCLNR